MRLEFFIIGITFFLIYNTYVDGKYTKMLMSFKKYYKMIFYAILGIGIYYVIKTNPNKSREMLLYANNMVKFMPINKNSMDMLSPIIDFTAFDGQQSFMENFNDITPSSYSAPSNLSLSNSANGLNLRQQNVKRSVSETKKKYVASNQDWKCGHCNSQLDHTFEIDHKIRLEYGGNNDVTNLIALCRNCHGKKTASENM